jgi:hypothetical protein
MARARACHEVARQLSKNGKRLVVYRFWTTIVVQKYLSKNGKLPVVFRAKKKKKNGKKWKTICEVTSSVPVVYAFSLG